MGFRFSGLVATAVLLAEVSSAAIAADPNVSPRAAGDGCKLTGLLSADANFTRSSGSAVDTFGVNSLNIPLGSVYGAADLACGNWNFEIAATETRTFPFLYGVTPGTPPDPDVRLYVDRWSTYLEATPFWRDPTQFAFGVDITHLGSSLTAFITNGIASTSIYGTDSGWRFGAFGEAYLTESQTLGFGVDSYRLGDGAGDLQYEAFAYFKDYLSNDLSLNLRADLALDGLSYWTVRPSVEVNYLFPDTSISAFAGAAMGYSEYYRMPPTENKTDLSAFAGLTISLGTSEHTTLADKDRNGPIRFRSLLNSQP